MQQHEQSIFQSAWLGDTVYMTSFAKYLPLRQPCTLALNVSSRSDFVSSLLVSRTLPRCIASVYVMNNPQYIDTNVRPQFDNVSVNKDECLLIPNFGNNRAPYLDVSSTLALDVTLWSKNSSNMIIKVLRNIHECNDEPYAVKHATASFTGIWNIDVPGYYRIGIVSDESAHIVYHLTIHQVKINVTDSLEPSCEARVNKPCTDVDPIGYIYSKVTWCDTDDPSVETTLNLKCPKFGFLLYLFITLSLLFMLFLICLVGCVRCLRYLCKHGC